MAGRRALAVASLGGAARAIVAVAAEGVWGMDPSGRTTFLNPAAERMTGWSLAELGQRNGHLALHHESQRAPADALRDCPIQMTLADGKARHVVDEVFWHRTGHAMPVEYGVAPIVERGVTEGVVVVFTVVSERRAAEERLLRAERMLARLGQDARIGMWEWDIAADRLWWSEELMRMVGATRADFGGRYEDFLSRLEPDERPRIDAIVRRAIEQRRPFKYRTPLRLPDGSSRLFDSLGDVIVDESGEPVRMAGTAVDVTEAHRLEQQLELERRRADRLAMGLRLASARASTAGLDLEHDVAERLTPREREVLKLIAGGLTSEGIANALSLSTQTVRTHARNIMDKLGANTRAQAVAIAVRRQGRS